MLDFPVDSYYGLMASDFLEQDEIEELLSPSFNWPVEPVDPPEPGFLPF